jgi:hypothetical protein
MNPRRPALVLLLALLAALAPPGASAQTLYKIEIIVFAHPGGDARWAETWREDPGLPDTSAARPVSDGGGVSPLGPGAYRMSGIWQGLRASGRYQPLRHLAWVQAGVPRSRAPLILVGDGPDSPVYGTLQVSRGRFLHVDVDLLYRDTDLNVRFTTTRRMRSNEIHYLDHPLFGLLVLATPVED